MRCLWSHPPMADCPPNVADLYARLIPALDCRHCGDVCIMFGMDDLALPKHWSDGEPVWVPTEVADRHREIAAMAQAKTLTADAIRYVQATLEISH